MKISELVSVLKDLEKEYGDKHIWSLDGLGFPCPRSFEIELTPKVKRTEYGISGGKTGQHKRIEVCLEFEDGVKLEDRSFWEIDD